jgi:YidC/Oxa1 family membrane protein insertase
VADLFGAIERALGWLLGAVYGGIPSFALAIVVLTVATRLILLPLAVKQIRSMRAMQQVGPELKKVQQKYKDLQKKAKDRAEVQQLRLKLNEETMALYRTHGVNPLGGCLPTLAQMPVFIALFSVLRASLVIGATTATMGGAAIPDDHFDAAQRAATVCRPVEESVVDASPGVTIDCITQVEGAEPEPQQFELEGLQQLGSNNVVLEEDVDPSLIALCVPVVQDDATTFHCRSATGTGHLPRDSELFADVNSDRAQVLGVMHPGCTPNQSTSEQGQRQCTASEEDAGILTAIPYYLLVLLIAGTQYVSGRQMLGRQQSAGGAQEQQQRMMMRIMPLFIGFISLNFPAGLNFYYLIFNLWQMGQQRYMIRHQAPPGTPPTTPRKPGFFERMRDQMQGQLEQRKPDGGGETAADATPEAPAQAAEQPAAKQHPRSRKKKKRKRR